MVEKRKSSLGRFHQRLKTARMGGDKLDISFLLEEAANLDSQEERIKWAEQILVWIRLSGGKAITPQTSLKFLFNRLDHHPAWKAGAAAAFQKLLLESSFVHLFADVGVHSNYDFFREGTSRLMKRIFPTHGDPKFIDISLSRIFIQEGDSQWLADLPEERKAQIADWLSADTQNKEYIFNRLLKDAAEASTILCVRAAAISVQREVTDRAEISHAQEIPMLRLREKVEAFFSLLLHQGNAEAVASARQAVENEILACRKFLDSVHAHLEQFGVSLSLVFSLDAVASILDRLSVLVHFCESLRFAERKFDPWSFFVRLLENIWEEQKVGPLIKSSFQLLSRKVVERTGATGENYITANPAEYSLMFKAAMGGGFITAFTGLAKLLGPQDLPPFVLGLYAFFNYAGSFILMHHLHFKLATKQPAMTAAALAARLREIPENDQLQEFIDLVARISRSQFAAAAGNILAVIPMALAIDYCARNWTGSAIVNTAAAMKTLHSLDPLQTLTIVYAAFTGILLWLSGLFSGYVENAFVYYQFPQAIQSHRSLNNFFGENGSAWIVQRISANLPGWASSIALAFFLAFIPLTAAFWGLPLDVRHVTLSAGSASFAFSGLGWEGMNQTILLHTIAGVLLIGIMNFGISFAMAFHVAVRANDVPRVRVKVILRSCFQELLRRPRRFFFPPRQLMKTTN